MSTKLAACDPCRFAKLACDHVRPVCGRCRSKGLTADCVYRTRPFKKRKAASGNLSERAHPVQQPIDDAYPSTPQTTSLPNTRQYPNPGYLGTSSHTTIFQNFSPVVNGEASLITSDVDVHDSSAIVIDNDQSLQGAKLIEDIFQKVRVDSCVALVDHWTTRVGVNLALAGPFVTTCARSLQYALDQLDRPRFGIQELTAKIFRTSCQPITVNRTSTMDNFIAWFSQLNIRWETIGLFFTAVSRASINVTEFPSLFSSIQERESLKRLALRYADRCLDLSLSLDYLNDLQLVLQYENFINHSFVDGDQSYHAWRRLGDVISSIFALGYHEKIMTDGPIPEFLIHLRESVVARVYSADKNVSIFFGRPPRMIHKYCTFGFLEPSSAQNDGNQQATLQYLGWTSDQEFDYALDTWWSFICALLKEEVLDLSLENDSGQKQGKASAIKDQAHIRWTTLPSRYRYTGDLKLYQYKPIERDFIASARLNYLHVLFLLRLVFMQNAAEQDSELLSICAETLNLTTKVAVMKERLTNSGTGLIWRICHYGLPAAGILCLSLLSPASLTQPCPLSRARILQDLGVLVAQVDTGVLIDPSDSDYALLSAATRAIQTILDRVLASDMTRTLPTRQEPEMNVTVSEGINEDWMPWSTNENWDFELDFWTNLAEHPTLATDNLAS